MIGWHDPEVRTASFEAHYFDQAEIHNPKSQRYELLLTVLGRVDHRLPDLFRRAWESSSLNDCPPLASWNDLVTRVIHPPVVLGWEPISLPPPALPIAYDGPFVLPARDPAASFTSLHLPKIQHGSVFEPLSPLPKVPLFIAGFSPIDVNITGAAKIPGVPHAPLLRIGQVHGPGVLTLVWMGGQGDEAYELQEADEESFSTAKLVASTSARQALIENSTLEKRHYRVRAVNKKGPGPWSNVIDFPR
jgi:hypothetical protein